MPQILREIPGVSIVLGGNDRAYVKSSRVQRPTYPRCKELEGGSGQPTCECFAQVYVDNMLVSSGEVPNINRIPPYLIEGIEYYSSRVQTPIQYADRDAECGVLVIWTRRGGD